MDCKIIYNILYNNRYNLSLVWQASYFDTVLTKSNIITLKISECMDVFDSISKYITKDIA
jgi:hypothetical protein